MLLTNAFSISMIGPCEEWMPNGVSFQRITPRRASEMAQIAAKNGDLDTAVGHADTAALFSGILGVPVVANRASVMLVHGVPMLVGQYKGPRLPEGASTLPEGASIEWWLVRLTMLSSEIEASMETPVVQKLQELYDRGAWDGR